MATTVKQCSCSHEFQDNTYGKGMRLHNLAAEGKEIRCTICGKASRTDGSAITKKK